MKAKRIKVQFRIFPFSQNPTTGKVYADEDLLGWFELEMSQTEYKRQWISECGDTLIATVGKNQKDVPNSYKQTGIIVPWKITKLND